MNTRQLNTWKQLVQQCETQCERQPYSSINVASEICSEAIVAAGALVELVTPALAELLVRLAANQVASCIEQEYLDSVSARALAAKIREALEANDD